MATKKKIAEEVKAVEAKVEKAVKDAPAKAKAAAKKVEKAVKAPVQKVKAAKLEIIVQSPTGGNITAEEIAAKVPAGADSVYVRVDQNKLWWVKDEETGSVDIWE